LLLLSPILCRRLRLGQSGAGFESRRHAAGSAGENLVVFDIEQAQPALLAHRQCDEAAEFDELRLGKMFMEPLPKAVVGIKMPGDRFGIGKRGFLSFVVLRRFFEIEQIIILRFFQTCLGRFLRALVAAILTIDRARHVDATQLFDGMIADAVFENIAPRICERPESSGHVGANRGSLGPWRAFAAAAIELFDHGRIGQSGWIDIADTLSRHRNLLDLNRL